MNSRFSIPDDLLALRMENDLLSLENEHLRGRKRSGAADSEEMEELRAQLDRAQRHLATERARISELGKARSDLRWFLGRLNGSVVGPLFRRFGGFRTLVDRWLEP